MKRRGWIKAARAFVAGAGLGFLAGMIAPPREGQKEGAPVKGPEEPKKHPESAEIPGSES